MKTLSRSFTMLATAAFITAGASSQAAGGNDSYSTDMEEVQSITAEDSALSSHALAATDGLYNLVVLVNEPELNDKTPVTISVRDMNNEQVILLTPDQPVVLAHLADGSYTLIAESDGQSQQTPILISDGSVAAVKIEPLLLTKTL